MRAATAKATTKSELGIMPAVPEIPEDNAKASQTLTAEDTAIFNRVAADQDDWRTIDPRDVEDFSLGNNPFAIPPPAQAEEDAKRFKFVWRTRTPQRLDELRSKQVPFKWWVCNSTNTPFLKDYLDRTLGCVCREDQMLVFKPWWMFEKEQAYKRGLADAKDRSGDLMSRDGEERDGVQFKAGRRNLGSASSLRQEVLSSDITFGDDRIDRAEGRFEPAGEDFGED